MNRQTTATRGIRGIPGISPKWNSNVAHALLLAIFHYPINISSGIWEVDIPYDWEYGQWDRIHLYPIQVKVLVVKCVVCGEEYRIYPSFVLPGTTLTLSALIFVAFVYRFSELTWRDIPEKFCTEEDRISHSTLYKAVHGLGKSILVQEEKIREGVQKLHAACHPKNGAALPGSPRMKALYDHTRGREGAVNKILLPLSHHCLTESLFSRAFYTYLRPLRLILSSLSPPISIIYK